MTELAKINEWDNMAAIYDMELVKDQICRGADNAQLTLFLMTCHRTGLDPFARQIYYINGKPPITSIDGYRLVAQRSGEYAGQTEPMFWDGTDWVPVWNDYCIAARVGVHRRGFVEPMFATARLDAYRGTTPIWKQKTDVMLSKCAEALALRKAFPQELSGLYTADEFSNQGVDIIADSKAAGDYQTQPIVKQMKRTPPPAKDEPIDAEYSEMSDLSEPLPGPAMDSKVASMSLDDVNREINGDNREVFRVLGIYATKQDGSPMIDKNGNPFRSFKIARTNGETVYATRFSCDWTAEHIEDVQDFKARIEERAGQNGKMFYTLHDLAAVGDD